jgi:hypothetical protein
MFFLIRIPFPDTKGKAEPKKYIKNRLEATSTGERFYALIPLQPITSINQISPWRKRKISACVMDFLVFWIPHRRGGNLPPVSYGRDLRWRAAD